MKAVLCPVCNGAGKLIETPPKDSTSIAPCLTICHGCNGKGWVLVPEHNANVFPLTFPDYPGGTTITWKGYEIEW